MFENIRNRMWLLGIAKREIYSSLTSVDTGAVKAAMTKFERDMRAEGSWPFDDPDTLSLFFSAWFGKQHPPLRGSTRHSAERSARPPWTPEQWKTVTETAPELIRRRFAMVEKAPQELLNDGWSLGYVWGVFSAFIKAMPDQTISAAAPELFRAGFEALFGRAGSAGISRCIAGLSQSGDVDAGVKAGEADTRTNVSDGPSCSARQDDQSAREFIEHFRASTKA